MPFIPHTQHDIEAMLETIGVGNVEQLFDEIPASIQVEGLKNVPEGASEMAVLRQGDALATQGRAQMNFAGAGAYEHHIPSAVWDIVSRGEFYSAYTPYQAEASQGTLQLIYEYQSMMSQLTAMDAANASLYDGATALAESVLMAVRANRAIKTKRVLLAGTLNPRYREVVQTVCDNQSIELVDLAFSAHGTLDLEQLGAHEEQDYVALVVAQPNFFGQLESVNVLCDWAHQRKALLVAVVNPMSLSVLSPPGEWGETGADIACGEGQPLGIPLSGGGPYCGFMCAKQALIRQMPGRIVGQTTDMEGQPGFALTLQAREQHIRRSKATSNICTNQSLLVTASSVYLSLLGADGLSQVAAHSMENTRALVASLTAIPGVKLTFDEGTYFHEAVIEFEKTTAMDVLKGLSKKGILGGYALGNDFLGFENKLLICATETKTAQDIQYYADQLAIIMEASGW